MRLGQLARKLALRPAEIVKFLAGKDISIEDRSNSRLMDDHVALILGHFAPARMEEVMSEQEETEEPAVVEPAEIPESVAQEIPVVKSQEQDEPIQDAEGKSEVIRAPKVELPGLKVLGKIEFPEIKKKEPVQTPPAAEETAALPDSRKPRPEYRKGQSPRNDRRDNRPKKNPLALQREQAALDAERKRKAEALLKKELRTQHYMKKVKPVGPTKALKLMNEPVEEMEVEHSNPPRTVFGKFLRWLTT